MMIIPNKNNMFLLVVLVGVLGLFSISFVDGYVIDETYSSSSLSLRLVDVETNISPVSVLLLNKETTIIVEGLHWSGSSGSSSSEISSRSSNNSNDNNDTSNDNNNYLNYTTYLNEQVVDSGTIKLSDNPLELPTSIEAGSIIATESGTTNIRVEINDGSTATDYVIVVAETTTRAYQSWTIAIPIGCAFIMFLVLNVDIIYALFSSMLIGSWIAEGSFIAGIRKVFDTYLLQAISDSTHVSM